MPLLELRAITKRFPGVTANDGVCLDVEAGEIHALLGENGAGKSTLMNCLCGLYQPDDGQILVRGQPVEIIGTAEAVRLGIGMIHQHFMLVPQLTVTENVAASLRSERRMFLDLKSVRQQIGELAARHGLEIEPDRYVWQLSVGAQQRVEIVRALLSGAEILILDEPTAVLTPQEVVGLFAILRALQAAGKTIVFISHKLDEVMKISDRVTVLRDGRVVATVSTQSTTAGELARMMVGRDIVFQVQRESCTCGAPELVVEDLHAGDARQLPILKGVSLEVCCGEILGIAGVDGNGQLELAEAIAGLGQVAHGRVRLGGVDVTHRSPRWIRRQGLGYIPAERQTVGAVGQMSVAENLALTAVDRPPNSHHGWLDRTAMRTAAAELIHAYDVRTRGPDSQAGTLSGGNLQKVVLAREIASRPRVLICAQPTRGLDVGAIEFVHQQILAVRARGAAVLLISTELDEILSLSDRIAVMCKGEIVGTLRNEDVSLEQLGLMMAGHLRLPC